MGAEHSAEPYSMGGSANYQMFDYKPSYGGAARRRDTNDRSRGGRLISRAAERGLLVTAGSRKKGSRAARRHLRKLVHVTPVSKLFKDPAARRRAASVRRSLRESRRSRCHRRR